MSEITPFLYPRCYSSLDQYVKWKYWRKVSNEVCSICSDCPALYRMEMTEKKRCDFEAQNQILHGSKAKGKTNEPASV